MEYTKPVSLILYTVFNFVCSAKLSADDYREDFTVQKLIHENYKYLKRKGTPAAERVSVETTLKRCETKTFKICFWRRNKCLAGVQSITPLFFLILQTERDEDRSARHSKVCMDHVMLAF